MEQTIYFTDKYKNKEKQVNISLVEIARDCVYMFYSLMSLLEVNYILLTNTDYRYKVTKLQKLEET